MIVTGCALDLKEISFLLLSFHLMLLYLFLYQPNFHVILEAETNFIAMNFVQSVIINRLHQFIAAFWRDEFFDILNCLF